MNTYKGRRSADCATFKDTAVQNSGDQVTVNHVNQLVSIDPGWRGHMSTWTKEPFSSGSVPCALTLIPPLGLCIISTAASSDLLCIQLSSPVPTFPAHASRVPVLQPCSMPKCLQLPSG